MIALLLLIVAGCGAWAPAGGPLNRPLTQATVASTLGACIPYDDLPEAYGSCLVRYAIQLPTLAEASEVCARAGSWEADCRGAWAVAQRRANSKLTTAELIEACGPNQDCVFELVDADPGGDVIAQIETCHRLVPTYAGDCVEHALRRWVRFGPPDEAEAARVLAGAGNEATRIGGYMGVAAGCFHSLECPEGTDLVARACADARDQHRLDPRRCFAQ